MTYHHTDVPDLPLDKIQWQEIGEDDPGARLLAHIRIAGCDMHLEAREVVYVDHLQTTVEYPDDLGLLAEVSGTGVFRTIEFGGREYFLFALPYGR